MTEAANTSKVADLVFYHGQTLFMTASPFVRYPIALTLAAVGAYMFIHSPPFAMSSALVYALVAGVYAWELSAALTIMAVIFCLFKLLAMLPLLAAIAVVIVACAFIGF
ncbi:MAG TPA: hypothetical protein VEF76_10355 [Patescibacteria group bacterium]|nr:hypothetical protein [Patescibacteria group bacterium]